MTQRTKLPARIVKAVEIKRVRLIDATLRARVSSRAELGEAAQFVGGADARIAGYSKESGIFTVIAAVDARVIRREVRESTPAVSIRASYELTYALPKEFDASRKDLTAFAKTNAVFNVWPYWREFIQSVFARMDLPQPVLPVYLIESAPLRKSRARKRSESGRSLGPGPQATKLLEETASGTMS